MYHRSSNRQIDNRVRENIIYCLSIIIGTELDNLNRID